MIETNNIPSAFLSGKNKKKVEKIEKEESAKNKSSKKKKKGNYIIHLNTGNYHFVKLYKLLKDLGIENNKFFLKLYDAGLQNIDPHSQDLDLETKARIVKECQRNYWYFIRECVRIPVEGSPIGPGQGKQYVLHRGNLAISYCIEHNFNFYCELPRQNFKSVSVDIILLWLFNFGTSNAQMLIMNKSDDDAKDNLNRIKTYRDSLPEYLQFKYRYNEEGKRLNPSSSVEKLKHHKNNNQLITKSSATTKFQAMNKGRGCTQAIQWFDEFAFMMFNDIILDTSASATSQASEEAEKYGKPHFRIITSTPGDLEDPHASKAYEHILDSAKFIEELYDKDDKYVEKYIDKNSKNGYLYIKFNYKQLGRSQDWLDKQIKELRQKWDVIRREVLLEWRKLTGNSPFAEEDLDDIRDMIRDPIKKIQINKYYHLELYEELPVDELILIGVDVASGHKKDSSAVVLVSSKTKRIIGSFTSNKIDITQLSKFLYTLCTKCIAHPLLCIERNYAEGVISNLKSYNSGMKNIIYSEIDKNELKETLKNGHIVDKSTVTRTYGVWTGEKSRNMMMDILVKTVSKYKERVAIQQMHDELLYMEYTGKNDRIEHSKTTHDDTVLAYLMAMYVYYYGEELGRYGLFHMDTLDDDIDEDEDALLLLQNKNRNRLYEQNKRLEQNNNLTFKDYQEQVYREMEECENGNDTIMSVYSNIEDFNNNDNSAYMMEVSNFIDEMI